MKIQLKQIHKTKCSIATTLLIRKELSALSLSQMDSKKPKTFDLAKGTDVFNKTC